MNLKVILLLLVLPAATAYPQLVGSNKQIRLSKFNIPAANYSGITRIDKEHYALVSDKEPYDGFYVFKIGIDSVTGNVYAVDSEGFRGSPQDVQIKKGLPARDCEGIAWCSSFGTLFISGEADQQILEYGLDGKPTGRKLNVPEHLGIKRIQPNCGFEALTYDEATKKFWTTTERTLNTDQKIASSNCRVGDLLRLQSFDLEFNPVEQYYYQTDVPTVGKHGRYYAFGVSALTALPNGHLLVMEREFHVAQNYLGSWVKVKIYQIKLPMNDSAIAKDTTAHSFSNKILAKELVTKFSTRLNLLSRSLANYEGMCLGPKLKDGRQTLILTNDSQGGFGNSFGRLKDYIKVLILNSENTKKEQSK